MDPFIESVLERRRLWELPRLKDLRCLFRDQAESSAGLTDAVVIAPHSDDAEISAAATILDLVGRGVRVTVCLVYAGHRCPGLSGEADADARTRRRVDEAQAACRITGAEFRFFDVSAYSRPNYLPSDEDIELVGDAFAGLRPQMVFVPPRFDHSAHQAARELTALGMYAADLRHASVLTYESPWNSLGGSTPPTHYLAFDAEMARRKEESIAQFVSQLQATDYVAYAEAHALAWKAKAREAILGHHDPCGWDDHDRTVGLEVFRLEEFDPQQALGAFADPIHVVLGKFRGVSEVEFPVEELLAKRV